MFRKFSVSWFLAHNYRITFVWYLEKGALVGMVALMNRSELRTASITVVSANCTAYARIHAKKIFIQSEKCLDF